jgi:hypothetical protein
MKMLVIGKNGTNGILNELIVLSCGCLDIIKRDPIKRMLKITNSAIAYA